jgi:NAD+ synthetase
MLAAQAKKHGRPLVFVNQVGGQDDLVFDGGSLVIDAAGEVRARGRELAEDLVIADVTLDTGFVTSSQLSTPAADMAAALDALALGTRDYARRCGFRTAVIGLSGGIDSALVACVAARALGAGNVWGVSMPSRYSSQHSRDDAATLARNLGIHYDVLPIERPFAAYLETLAPAFGDRPADATEENLQARVRGALLMALSNKHGHLVLSTGNKSELAVGYCTLYGDMCGGLAVISDVPKTMVYRLAEEVNSEREIIPRSTIDKPPSAELRPDQTDQDTLPPYGILDALLEAIVERGLDTPALLAEGFDGKTVADVTRMVRVNEHKRRQAAIGIKLTGKAFGPGRRVPIAHGWRG